MRSLTLFSLLLTASLRADDWPQWMGPERDGVYRETGVPKELPKTFKYRWKKPIGPGYSGPSVAGGKVYVMDRVPGAPKLADPNAKPMPDPKDKNKYIFPKATVTERTLCLSAATGEQLWHRDNDAVYQMSYSEGPRAAPTVHAGKVYALGAMGLLECLNADDGKLIWKSDFQKDFNAPIQAWGWAAHPFIDGDRVICLVGGKGAAVVAFNKDAGKELWRALDSGEVGYSTPMLATFGGKPQLIVYLSDGIFGLDPATGKKHWSVPFPAQGEPTRPSVPIPTPILVDGKIFITSGYEGEMLIDVAADGLSAKIIHYGTNINKSDQSDKEKNAGLHAIIGTPVAKDGLVYGVDFMGEFRCLDPKTGERKWTSLEHYAGKQALFGCAFLTPHEDRCFMFVDTGDLYLGALTPKGFEHASKTHLIDAVQPSPRGRRKVVWTPPAYSNNAIFIRNQDQILCAELSGS